MRLSPTYCRIQLFVFSFVCLHMIIPLPCNLYEAPAPHAVTPQGRDSFALFVWRGHLFVVISLSFFIFTFVFPSGILHMTWLRLNIHHRAAQKLILLMSLAAWIQSRISKSHLKWKKKPEKTTPISFADHGVISTQHTSVRWKKNRSVCFGLKWCHQGL